MSVVSTVRVFLSSPYRDMQAERSYLHDEVFPRVSEKFQEQGHVLEIIDPRYQAADEDEAEGIETFERALDDIERCRPHFLCLLGSNYGKVMLEVPDAIGRKHPAVRHFFRTSRIHLETLTGVLRDPSRATHSYFYFRKPEILKHIDPAEKPSFLPNNKLEALNEIESHKLGVFKEAIRHAGRPVYEYDCTWDSMTCQVAGLEALGARIENDLLSIIGLGEAPVAAVVEESTATGAVAAGIAAGALAGSAALAAAASRQSEPADDGWEAMATEEIGAQTAEADDADIDRMVAEAAATSAVEVDDGETLVSESEGMNEAEAEAAADEILSSSAFDAAAPPEPVIESEAVSEADAEAAAAGIFGGADDTPTAAADPSAFEVDTPPEEEGPADIVSAENAGEEGEAAVVEEEAAVVEEEAVEEAEPAEEEEAVEVAAEEEEAPKKKAKKKGGWFGFGKKKKK